MKFEAALKLLYSKIFLSVLLVILLLPLDFYVINVFGQTCIINEKMNLSSKMMNPGTYIIQDLTPSKEISQNVNISREKVTAWTRNLTENYDYGISTVVYDGNGLSSFEYMMVSENTLKYYPLSIARGRNFQSADFKSKPITPVLAGQMLAKRIPLNAVRTISNPIDGQRMKIRVIGQIGKNTFMPTASPLDKQYLNKSIILPETGAFMTKSSYDRLSMMVDGLIVSQRKEKVSRLAAQYSQLGLGKIKVSSARDYFGNWRDKNNRVLLPFILAAVLVFLLIGVFAAYLMAKISEINYEQLKRIRILGGSHKSIFQLLWTACLILVLVSLVISVVFNLNMIWSSLRSGDPEANQYVAVGQFLPYAISYPIVLLLHLLISWAAAQISRNSLFKKFKKEDLA